MSTYAAALGADRQRIFLSVHATTTDVITEVRVPATTADYGVLLPVVGIPTLDPLPVPAAELDALERATAPRVYISTSSDGGCGSAAKGDPSNGAGTRGVNASPPTIIGPVTAVVLTADSGEALNVWLAANGFVLPPYGQALVDTYVGLERSFIAIRRADTAAPGDATSVGVHFTLPGDARALPLRFASLGAGPSVSFTVVVAAATAVAPGLPFEALTLTDLDVTTLRAEGYAAALAAAVTAHAYLAFVIEGVFPRASLPVAGFPTVSSLIDPSATLTRLSTILPAAALTTDVALDQPFAGVAPSSRYAGASAPGRSRAPIGTILGATAFLACALVRQRRRG